VFTQSSSAAGRERNFVRLLDPIAECLTVDVARRIVKIRTDAQTKKRLVTLRAKANDGTLSAAERAEYEDLVEGFDLVSILKAKARAILTRHAG
jgi:hypothetical protein